MLRLNATIIAASFLAAACFAAGPPTRPTTAPALETRQIKLPNTLISFKMVKVPPGTIARTPKKDGDQPKTIELKSFWISQTEVTWQEYDVFFLWLDTTPFEEWSGIIGLTQPSRTTYGRADLGWGHDGYPVIHPTFGAARGYCRWLSYKLDRKFRLPTEAEWEYAANAGLPPQALDEETLKKLAWYRENSKNEDGEETTHPVGRKLPNAWGLYDMLGNVGEWVTTDDQSVVKGGSYRHSAKVLDPAMRLAQRPSWQERDPRDPKSDWWLTDAPFVGFRVVMEE